MFEALTPDSIETVAGNHKIVLLSPRVRNRNALLSAFIRTRDAYFYALTPQDNTLNNFLKGLVQSLSEDNPGFGKQMAQALDARKLKAMNLNAVLRARLCG